MVNTSKKGIYLREEGEYVGPFHSQADAEIFLDLMELSGVDCEGIDIVVEDAVDIREPDGVTVEEKRRLLTAREKPVESIPYPESHDDTDFKGSEPGGEEGNHSKPDGEGQ